LVLVAGAGCSRGRRAADERGGKVAAPAPAAATAATAATTTAPSGKHWVQDANVRAVMKQIAAATGSWPQDLPPHAEAANPLDLERAFNDSARLARTLAKEAAELPAAVAERPMPEEARRGFIAQAQTLRRHALELDEAARLKKVAEMQRALGRINATCFACHGTYRDVAGELDRAEP
jgi:cytochrome c556